MAFVVLVVLLSIVPFIWVYTICEQRNCASALAISCCAGFGPAITIAVAVSFAIHPVGFWGPSDFQVVLLLGGLGSAVLMELIGIVWAYNGRSRVEPRGFPIEPQDSIAPKDSDSV